MNRSHWRSSPSIRPAMPSTPVRPSRSASRPRNAGPLDVNDLIVFVEGLNGTEVRQNGAAAQFVSSFTTSVGQFPRAGPPGQCAGAQHGQPVPVRGTQQPEAGWHPAGASPSPGGTPTWLTRRSATLTGTPRRRPSTAPRSRTHSGDCSWFASPHPASSAGCGDTNRGSVAEVGRTAIAALRPLSAITLPAGWVAAPHR